jgi:hypothetical protein
MWFAEAIHERIALAGAMFNFMPSWWYRGYGLVYGQRMVFDPDYRVETHRAMRRALFARYGEVGLGSRDPEPCVIAPDWENAQGPAAGGGQVEYPLDNYPISHHLTEEQIAALRVPEDVAACYPFCESIRQVLYLNDKLGLDAPPTLNARGVLNEACIIQGEKVLGDLYGDPEAARRLLGYAHGLILAILSHNQAVAPASGYMLVNCTEIMVGPRTYQQLLFPYDLASSAACAALGLCLSLHHCGCFDRFASLYRQLGPMALIEIGSESSIRLALDTFPEAQIQYIVPTALVCRGTRAEVGERMDAILEEGRGDWHRLRLNIPDLEYGMPDENLFEICARLMRAA